MAAPVPIPDAELAPLVTWRVESGFHGVYRHKRKWRARVRRPAAVMGTVGELVSLGSYPTPVQAAKALAAWYRETYGPDWPTWHATRFTNRGRARPAAAGFEGLVRAAGGTLEPIGVFPDRAAAVGAVRAEARRRGLVPRGADGVPAAPGPN